MARDEDKRISAGVRYLGLQRTEELILKGWDTQRILGQLSAEGFTESLDTARRWSQEIYQRWAEEDNAQRPHRRNMWRMRLEARYRRMLDDLDDPTMKLTGHARAAMYDSLAKVELLAIKLDGLDAPVKIQHMVNGADIDVRAMSPDRRRARVEELLEKRQRALASGVIDAEYTEHNDPDDN